MRTVVPIGLALLFAVALQAQSLIVKDKETEQALEQVIIHSEPDSLFTTTNTEGRSDISAFRELRDIYMERVGYKTVRFSFSELAKMDFTVYLEPLPFKTDEIVVTANRWQQEKSDVSNKVIIIRPMDISLHNPQTAADLLNTSGEIYIQKSQLAGGSPMIRGLAANRILIAVDGVRMNTAIFRSGNLQNVISLDPLVLERTEVFFGPASVIYGSDALGGVLNFFTLNPLFSADDKSRIHGASMIRTSSANFEKTGHADISVGFRKWAFLTSATYTDFDNQKMGRQGPDEYLRRHYVISIADLDSMASNPNPREQVPSGYQQFNLMQKIHYKPAARLELNLGLHYSTTSAYPRYDRLIIYRGNNLRSAEWYYGPQVWSMNSLNLRHSGQNNLYDRLGLVFTYQFFEESRHDRDFRDTELRHRKEMVNVFSLNLDFERNRDQKHLLSYGAEVILNSVGSSAENENISKGTRGPGPTRYPDGSTWNSFAAYLHYRYKASSSLAMQSGLRFNKIMMEAKFDTTFYPFPFTKARIEPSALTGSVGLVYQPEIGLQINANLSSGFRAPNIDDVGKVFDSEPGSVVIPNPELKPEYAYNAEVNFSKIFGERFKMDVACYYTLLKNVMVRRNYRLNGQDSIFYDGELSQVQAIQNSAKADVWGIEAGLELKLSWALGLLSHFNYQKGKEELEDGSSAPLRHAAPWFGDIHLTYAPKRFIFDFYAIYQGQIMNKELAPEEQSKDYMYALDTHGRPYSPRWYTLNLKTLYQVNHRFNISIGVENITDQLYRPYSSAIAGPARNFIIALRTTY